MMKFQTSTVNNDRIFSENDRQQRENGAVYAMFLTVKDWTVNENVFFFVPPSLPETAQ
jgi:hypothetical protein